MVTSMRRSSAGRILDGRQPAEAQLNDLLDGFPLGWEEQRSTFRGL